ncbi:hypothetical protein L2719_20705 [Shewanella schlegeliana]|uniref:Uncharacterized protein n=1 Tax=Shewanella schlegeliana TaxID=190308 RepID=A0ABS1T3M7_9GAMM|nr:hypothetical protein [Shewanella schlegeliana]MBL4915405.1 hypothetical protein [Shewanella schlegeliana]MCL1111947.1 hypothetical protein [Shewanella schlegeliana]GIU24960.1 hypothetical protein TUM4433_09160 [Shewanella schlegeliana]
MENYFFNIYNQSDFALCKVTENQSDIKEEHTQQEEREEETPSYILGYN